MLGEGGMGRVFLARERATGKDVVIKVLHPQIAAEPKFREMFRREMQNMSRFRHPHVVEFYESAVDGPQGPCIIMEFINGKPLDELLARRGRFEPYQVGLWLGQMCSALQYAHSLSLIHRDLKPSNLMIAEPLTTKEKLKIMDFGLSQLTSVPQLDLEELRGGVKRVSGTPEYFSPEQSRGDEIDARSDLYAVGVILFELLTGKRPFEYETPHQYMIAHASKYPPKFEHMGVRNVPPAIEAVVQRCLYKYPGERPRDANELAQLYERALGEKITVNIAIETVPEIAATPTPVAKPVKPPGAITYTLEAWMPEKIAVLKLQGFLETCGGEVLESSPGLVRVRLIRPGPPPAEPKGGFLAKLSFGKKDPPPPPKFLNLDMYMEKRDPSQANRLTLTLIMRAENEYLPNNPEARSFCEKVSGEIAGYLMAKRG
jgi:serine/threonine protein kinase